VETTLKEADWIFGTVVLSHVFRMTERIIRKRRVYRDFFQRV